MQAHAACAWRPIGSGGVTAQAAQFVPALPAVSGAEQRGIFHSGIDRVRIVERWLQVPHSFELPGMLCSVIPLVGGKGFAGFGRSVIHEFVAYSFRRALWSRSHFASWGLTRLAAIVGALNYLPAPAAGL